MEKEPKFEKLEKSEAEIRDEKEREILESKGWVLVSNGTEETTDERKEEDIENEYREKHKNDDFLQVMTVPKHEIRDGELKRMWHKEGYVFMRTKKEAEKEKARRKEIRKELIRNLREPLKDIGFKKDKRDVSTWQRELENIIQVFNLQTSWSSHKYYINLGIFLRDKDKKIELPKELDCDIRKRLSNFVSRKNSNDYSNSLNFDDMPNDFEGEAPELERIEKARGYIEKYAIPFFEAAKTKEGAEEFIEKIKEPQEKEGKKGEE